MPIRLVLAALTLLLYGLPARSDWRETVGAFRVGFVASGNAGDATARMEPFRLAFAEGLGVNVELFAARDYATLVDALGGSRIEYAILSSAAHALAKVRCDCIEPVVIARDGDGSLASRQVLIAAAGQPENPAQYKGRRIGALRSSAFGGFDIAIDGLNAAGLDLAANDAALQLFESSAALLQGLADGQVDAVIGWVAGDGPADSARRGTMAQMSTLGIDAARFRIVWQSVAVPNRLHSVRRSLPGEAKSKLREILSAMFDADPVAYDSVEPDHGGGFIVARESQIEPLVEIIRRMRGSDDSAGQ